MYQSPYQSAYGNPYANNYGMSTYGQNQYLNPQQMVRQPQMQPQPQVQYETPIQDIRFVTSEEAKAYIVMPNTKALLIDRQNGIAHLKSADNMGQSVSQFFRFEAVNADGTPLKPQEPMPQVDFSDFIKKSDISQLGFVTVEQYNTLSAKLDQLQKQIANSTKPNTNK